MFVPTHRGDCQSPGRMQCVHGQTPAKRDMPEAPWRRSWRRRRLRMDAGSSAITTRLQRIRTAGQSLHRCAVPLPFTREALVHTFTGRLRRRRTAAAAARGLHALQERTNPVGRADPCPPAGSSTFTGGLRRNTHCGNTSSVSLREPPSPQGEGSGAEKHIKAPHCGAFPFLKIS